MNLYLCSICFKFVLLQVTQVLKHVTLEAYILKALHNLVFQLFWVMTWHSVQYCTVLRHIITQRSYSVSFIVVKPIDHQKKTFIIWSCFLGLMPVLIFAVCEIMFCTKAAGFLFLTFNLCASHSRETICELRNSNVPYRTHMATPLELFFLTH